MKRKIFILIPLIFLLCGCSAEVNINIDEKMRVSESIDIKAYADEYYTQSQLEKAFRQYVPIYAEEPIVDTMPDEKVSGVTYYNRHQNTLNNGYEFTYDYTFNFNNYNKARTVKGAFKSSTIQVNKKDQEILLSTDKNEILFFNEYPSLDNITINITTSYPAKENNADYINGNVYTWKFNKDTKKNIYLLLDTSPTNKPNKVVENNEKKEETSIVEKYMNKHPFLIAIIAILSFIMVICIISKVTKH